MPDIYHLDYETRSSADLKKVGAYRYAADPSTRILMFAIAKNDEEPLLWFNPALFPGQPGNAAAHAMLSAALADPTALLYAHNAQFESAVSKYRMEQDIGMIPPPVEKWRCTAALARKAGLRPSLANVGEDLGLKQLKFGQGYQLIRKFSIPQRDSALGEFIDPTSEPKAFLEFGEYCVQDVRSEREVHHRLKPFELKRATLESFLFDARLNDRGIPVNVKALQHAQRIIEEVQTKVRAEFVKLTGLEPSQRDKVKELLETVYGVKLVNMQAKTLDAVIAYHDEPEDEEWDAEFPPDNEVARRILELYKLVSFAAIKKVKTMLDCVCPDGRLRGMFLWHGTGPGRASGKLVQPQNFKRPTINDADGVYAMICAGASAEDIETVYGNPLEAIANCIRNFIHDTECEMFDADYSAIQARLVAWAAGEEWRLKVFRTHGKIYEASACEMFGLKMEQITKPIRQKGKIAELALGFQGWTGALKKMGALEMGLKEDELEPLAKDWREANPSIVDCWANLEKAAKSAILNPGKEFVANKANFRCVKVAGLPYLLMTLPSSRAIAYPHPQWSSEDGITYYGQLPGTSKWDRVQLYGGKLLENLVMGMEADIMAGGCVNAEKDGFTLWALIHDQALARAQGELEKFVAALTKLPEWAVGLPLTADGSITPFYRKEP